jgi:sulfatase maturation enzyme AslB (radical SAM superfamily)
MSATNPTGTLTSVIEESLCIEVTTQCNSDCLHCFVHAGVAERPSLSDDVVKQIITEGYVAGYRGLHITGGEPLLWEGLFRALDYAFEIGYRTTTLNTNGWLLTETIAKKLAAYNGLSISVSLDGPKKLHDRLRGKGAYRQAVAGINRAIEAGVDLRIFTVARKSLLPVLPHFSNDLFNRYDGIKHLTLIQLIGGKDNGIGVTEELLDPNDFLQLVQTVALLNLCGLVVTVKNNQLVNIVSKLLNMPWVPQAHPLCSHGSMVIKADGNICLSHSSRDSFGKYAPGMIQKVLSSDEYWLRAGPNQSECPACKYSELCSANGMVQPWEHRMSASPQTPYCRKVLDKVTAGR